MVARRLTLLRHGQAEEQSSHVEDFERMLTPKGVMEVQEMAARMLRRALIPSLILVSSAERTRSTAAIMATACALDATQVQSVHELYLATPDTTWHVLTRCDPAVEHVLICGHNPGLSEIASRFGPSPRHRNLSTAGLATAVWQEGDWATLEPEFSDGCDMDDPEK